MNKKTWEVIGMGALDFIFLFGLVFPAYANTAPTAPSIVGPGEGILGVEYNFNISASDPDSDQVKYLVDWENDGATDYESPLLRSGTIRQLAHSFSAKGTFSIRAKAEDAFGAQSSSTIFTVVVNETNNPPVLDPIENKTLLEGQKISFSVSATDPDGDALSYSARDLPGGATYARKNFGEKTFYLFEWTPSDEQSGEYTVAFLVDDGKGGNDSEFVAITVKNVKPTTDSIAPTVEAITVSAVTEHSATISWITNEKATGKIEYGRLNAFNKSSGFANTYATSSARQLVGLDAGAPYQYRLIVKDEAGNEARSADGSFTTLSSEAVVEADLQFRIAQFQLARVEGNPRVYYITKHGRKKWIRNEKIFNSYHGNKWENVVVVSPGALDIYPEVNLIRRRGGYKVYKIEGDTKKWIKTAEEFVRSGYSWEDVLEINQTEFDFFQEIGA